MDRAELEELKLEAEKKREIYTSSLRREEKKRAELHPMDSDEDERVVTMDDIFKRDHFVEVKPKKTWVDRLYEEFKWSAMKKSAKKWCKEVLFAAAADTAIELVDSVGGGLRSAFLTTIGLKEFDKNLRKRSSKRKNRERFGNPSYESYGSRYSGRRGRSDYDFDDIYFGEKRDAELVLDLMMEKIDRTGELSVYDFLKMDQVDGQPERNDKNYGWTNLRKASVAYDRREDEYFLDLPDPIDLRD